MTNIFLKKQNPNQAEYKKKVKKSFVIANRNKFQIDEGAFVNNQTQDLKVRPKQSPVRPVRVNKNASVSPQRSLSYSRTIISFNKVRRPNEEFNDHAIKILRKTSIPEETLTNFNSTLGNTFCRASPRIIENRSRPDTKASSTQRPITSGTSRNMQLTKTSFSQINLHRIINETNEQQQSGPNSNRESIIPNRIMNSYARSMLRSKSTNVVTASFDNPMYHPQDYPDVGVYKYRGIHSNMLPQVDLRKFSTVEHERKATESTRIYNSNSGIPADSIERMRTSSEIEVKTNYMYTGPTHTQYTYYTNQATMEDEALDSLLASSSDNSAAVTPTVSKPESDLPVSSRLMRQQERGNIQYSKIEELPSRYRSKSFGNNTLKVPGWSSTKKSHMRISNLLDGQKQSYVGYDVKPGTRILPIKRIQIPSKDTV